MALGAGGVAYSLFPRDRMDFIGLGPNKRRRIGSVAALVPYVQRAAEGRRTGAYTRGIMAKSQRGYLRTNGYYGRYNKARSNGNRIQACMGGVTEKKFFEPIMANKALLGGVVGDAMLTIPQNTTESGRVGRKIKILNISGHVVIHFTQHLNEDATAGTSHEGWVALVHDTQANGTLPAVLDVFETATPNTFRNLAQQERFVVLWKKHFVHNPQWVAGPTALKITGAEAVRHWGINKKCCISIEYNDLFSTGVITTIRSGNIALMGLSTNIATLESDFRFRYVD